MRIVQITAKQVPKNIDNEEVKIIQNNIDYGLYFIVMKDVAVFIQNLYRLFNDRKVEEIIVYMDENVKWANGMEGGFVFGHEGVREYWTKQFGIIQSKVEPLTIEVESGVIKVHVHQVVHDVHGKLLADQLKDHYFRLKDDKITEFGIRDREVEDAGWTF